MVHERRLLAWRIASHDPVGEHETNHHKATGAPATSFG
jgi:hypothetical protein